MTQKLTQKQLEKNLKLAFSKYGASDLEEAYAIVNMLSPQKDLRKESMGYPEDGRGFWDY